MSVTTIVISDPELLAKIVATDGQIIFQGPEGTPAKAVETLPFGKPPPGYTPPISDEELERRRREHRTGKPLAEIMKRLQGGQP